MNESLKIEFGSGGRQMEGWLCTEIDECDIRHPLKWESQSVDECFTSHCPEHVSSAECMRFFKEVYRILKPGGKFRVIVPAIDLHMTRAHIQDLCEGHGHLQMFSFDSLRAMLFGAGFEIYNIRQTGRKPVDNHHVVFGEEKDYVESLRVEAVK
ncbi:MAG TPA: methyltransferase domain-containing protein [Terriglobales bacterium]|nr:methyltransferase domain-containing protein [Terriglobales bacterium]